LGFRGKRDAIDCKAAFFAALQSMSKLSYLVKFETMKKFRSLLCLSIGTTKSATSTTNYDGCSQALQHAQASAISQQLQAQQQLLTS
jgi:hypothetical protein